MVQIVKEAFYIKCYKCNLITSRDTCLHILEHVSSNMDIAFVSLSIFTFNFSIGYYHISQLFSFDILFILILELIGII